MSSKLDRGTSSPAIYNIVWFAKLRFIRSLPFWGVQQLTLIVGVCSLIFSSSYVAQAQERDWTKEEQAVKVAFLFNFARFIYLSDDVSNINICVIGQNPFGALIDSIDGRPVGERIVKLIKIENPNSDTVNDCSIAFVHKSQKSSIPKLVNIARQHSILLIAEMDEFIKMGGAVNFINVGKRTKFEVHLENLENAGVKLSSKLLQVAKVVK